MVTCSSHLAMSFCSIPRPPSPVLPVEFPLVPQEQASFSASVVEWMAIRRPCNVGIVPQTIMRKNSTVTQAKMSNVAQVKSVRFASCARYWVLMPEHMHVRMLSPNTMVSCNFLIGLLARERITVVGRIARLPSAKVLKAVWDQLCEIC